MFRSWIAGAFLILAACGAGPANAGGARPVTDWKQVVTDADMARIQNWRTAFVEALAQARAAGHGAEIDAEGPLLEPDAALGAPGLVAGQYRCRVIKVGARSPGLLPFVAYPAFTCRIADADGVLRFEKSAGSQRPTGVIYPGAGPRQVFLGTLMLGDERRPLEYGRDSLRDMAGAVERIGPGRWRLILPYPSFESLIDVIELVPLSG